LNIKADEANIATKPLRMKTLNRKIIRDILAKDERVLFVYLYGSFTEAEEYRDLDIAVYSKAGYDALRLSTDLKIALHEHTGMSPDFFDVRVIMEYWTMGISFPFYI
jgi:predicted nucleotidyltransferase